MTRSFSAVYIALAELLVLADILHSEHNSESEGFKTPSIVLPRIAAYRRWSQAHSSELYLVIVTGVFT